MKLIKNNFWLGRIQSLLVILDCPSALLSNKGALLLKQRALSGEQFDPILSFSINNLVLILQILCLKYSYHSFPISVLWLMGQWYIYIYIYIYVWCKNDSVDHENMTLKLNAYVLRSLLWNTCLQTKTFTYQNFTFLKKDNVNKGTQLIFDIFY